MHSVRQVITQIPLKNLRKCTAAQVFRRPLPVYNRNSVSMATQAFDHSFQNTFSNLPHSHRYFSVHIVENEALDAATYEKVCEETLDSLCDYFEALVDKATHITDTDVSYGNGVLTVNFGKKYGTYVINRQSPNKQIWLSSPTSGPKRYDYILEGSYWIYKHDGQTLHQLLQTEIPDIVKTTVDFAKCAHGVLKI